MKLMFNWFQKIDIIASLSSAKYFKKQRNRENILEQCFFTGGGCVPQEVSIRFSGARALTRPTAWKVWSMNLPTNTLVFITYLKSGGGFETKGNY